MRYPKPSIASSTPISRGKNFEWTSLAQNPQQCVVMAQRCGSDAVPVRSFYNNPSGWGALPPSSQPSPGWPRVLSVFADLWAA